MGVPGIAKGGTTPASSPETEVSGPHPYAPAAAIRTEGFPMNWANAE